MAASIICSIIFFLLFIILSLFVDVSVFAAQMEHRKLGGAKETMAMGRNLEENRPQSPTKIATHPSISGQAGSKTTKTEPQTHPNQATAQHKLYLSFPALQTPAVCNKSVYGSCTGHGPVKPTPCSDVRRCKRQP